MKIAKVYGLRYDSPKTAESTILHHLKRNGIVRRDAAEHIRRVSPEIVERWIERYQNGESLRQIAGASPSAVTVWNHLKARGMVLRKVEAQIKAVSRHEKRPFSGDENEKACMIGLRHGGLHVVKHGRATRVRVSPCRFGMRRSQARPKWSGDRFMASDAEQPALFEEWERVQRVIRSERAMFIGSCERVGRDLGLKAERVGIGPLLFR